jgi:hypothetical protein
MKAFSIGYIVTLSFLLVMTLLFATLGFYPAPVGPKSPQYPNTSYSTSNMSQEEIERQASRLAAYDRERKKYDEEQKTFASKHLLPYSRNVIVGWIGILVILQIIGVLFLRHTPHVAGAYAFTGVWAVIFGPFVGTALIAGSVISTINASQAEPVPLDSFYKTVTFFGVLGCVALTTIGMRFLTPAHIKKEK